jgi:squalene-hopene/tetraprenyl-beta-curcumene cyclase
MVWETMEAAGLFGRGRRGRASAGAAPPVPVEVLLDRDIHPDPSPLLRRGEAAAPGAEAGALGVERARLERGVERARAHLASLRDAKGFWCAELEANVGLDAQWIIVRRYLGIPRGEKEARLIRRLRSAQQPDGGWPLYHGARSDLSISIQAYFAGKLCGHRPDEPWMARAREFIRAAGGVERSSVINRIYLALMGEYPWEGIPAMPAILMLVPRGMAFNIYEMAYWARTCVVPLLVLYQKRRIVKVAPEESIEELYATPKEQLDLTVRLGKEAGFWRRFFVRIDQALKAIGKLPLHAHRDYAVSLAEKWILEHQDQDGGWGGIFPAMTHSIMALHVLGYPLESGPVKKGIEALELLEIDEGEETRIQPCVSPVWDTAWAVIALSKAGVGRDDPLVRDATDWLYGMQIRRKGDWSVKRPDLVPGGWAFQFHNDFYPDTDDSSAVLMALLNSHYRDNPRCHEAFDRGIQWLLGMQNEDGGWGAFEREVKNPLWNEIPFNDAKNMLDPSTSDVTGRCVEVLGKLGYPRSHPAVAGGLRFLLSEQEPDGKWWGRWGVNYVYGTWSALAALRAVKEPMESPAMRRGAEWLVSVQNEDGGWGESCRSYEGGRAAEGGSCASQTAWAVMGLLAAGHGDSPACRRGVEWLLERQREDGSWDEAEFTGTGFPGVFYLRYHLYRLYFPLLALARFRDLVR